MKYRMLTAEERKHFDEDFKYFLISNGVKNDEWVEMNEKSPEKAAKLVELFSDAVLDIVYKKLHYIEHRTPNSCMVFYAEETEMAVISLVAKKGSTVDLSTPESIHASLKNNPEELEIFQSTKKYAKEREMEIHEMIEQGCVPSHVDFWNSLKALLS